MTPSARLVGRRVALLTVLGLASPGWAETVDEIPNPRERNGSWVIDLADVIDAPFEARINERISGLERENGAEIAVVTIQRASMSPKMMATELFNRWGVGKKGADNGVLVLFALGDRRIEVETGYGAEGVLPDALVGRILDRHAVPSFKQGDYGLGLTETVEALAKELRKEESSFSKVTRRAGVSQNSAVVVLMVLFLVACWIAMVVWMRRPPRCPVCKEPMRKLTRAQERMYLSDVHNFEEEIGSVNHTVFRCDKHRETAFRESNRWFSGFSTCPSCRNRTATTTSVTTSSPTYTSTGTRRVTVTCKRRECGYERVSYETLPRLERTTSSSSSSSYSSSSSSGSFGGGSSGGGGAGRSW